MTVEELLDTYVSHDPRRSYMIGDYIIRYNQTFRSICLLRCIKNETTGAFNKRDWEKIECVVTGEKVDTGRSAKYLGDCATNITYKSGKNPQRLVRPLPQFQDIFFDNWTYPV